MRLILLLCTCLISLSAAAEPIAYAKKVIINSKTFDAERTLRVSLPASYDSSISSRYPVIYVIRGQLDLLATVASLNMLDKETPEFIVVGVDGSLGEFFPSKDGTQTQFSQFLHDEVMPYIEQMYRAAPYNVLTAHSMAAIFVMTDWLEDGESFSKYIIISPPLEGGQMIEQVKSKKAEQLQGKNPILITVADEGELTKEKFDDLNNVLAENGSVTFRAFPDQTHMSTRVNAMMHGLREAFPDWEPSKEAQEGNLDDLRKHYKALSKRYNMNVDIPLDMLARMSGMDSLADDVSKNKNAAAVVKYVLARNPADVDELFDTAEQLLNFRPIEGSKRLVSYICDEVAQDARCNGR